MDDMLPKNKMTYKTNHQPMLGEFFINIYIQLEIINIVKI